MDSSMITGSGVAGGVRINSAPGYVFPSGTAGRMHCVLLWKVHNDMDYGLLWIIVEN